MADDKKTKGGAEDEAKRRRPSRSSTRRRSPRSAPSARRRRPARAAAPRPRRRGAGPTGEKPAPARLRVLFEKEIVPALMKELGYKNPMQVPRLEKIVVNMGLGEADRRTPRSSTSAVEELQRDHRPEAGRHPRARSRSRPSSCARARRSACMVTLRRERMWEFLDRLVNVALPRVRDFKGVSPQGVRRPRQLHARHPRADHLPRDQLRQDRQDQGHEHLDRHHRARPTRRGARCSTHLGMPFRQLATARLSQWRTQHAASLSKLARSRSSRFASRNRCPLCGRPRAFIRKFELCRICFRELALRGDIPGVIKSSW